MSAPDVEGLLSQNDAIAIPGFGPVGAHTPDIRIASDDDGLTIQREDAERIRFNMSGGITIISAGEIIIMGGDIILTGDTTINGATVASATAGTSSAAGPGAHTHTLTRA